MSISHQDQRAPLADVVKALNSGYKWDSKTITYSFMTAVPSYYATDAPEKNNFVAFTAAQKAGAKRALDLWSEVSGIKFTEDTSGGGQIHFGTAKLPQIKGKDVGAYAYLPDIKEYGARAGDVWLNNVYSQNLDQSEGLYGFWIMLHEIGHAVGLKHPFEAPNTLTGKEDSYQYTLMSYTQHPLLPSIYPQTPSLYDIVAIQAIYGANNETRKGDDTYDLAKLYPNRTTIQAIWDAGGKDTIDLTGHTFDSIIDLTPGCFSSIGSENYGDKKKADNNPLLSLWCR